MEKIPNLIVIADNTLINKLDGNTLSYLQLKSDFANHLRGVDIEFIDNNDYIHQLPDIIIRFLGKNKRIIDWGEQVTGFKKAVFDKLYDDFQDPNKFLGKELGIHRTAKAKQIFRELDIEDARELQIDEEKRAGQSYKDSDL